jgi:hypothetical protein
MMTGDAATARALYAETLALARETGRTDVAVFALSRLGLITRDPAARQALQEEAVVLGRSLDDDFELRFALLWLGSHRLGQGEAQRARDCYAESHAASAAVGDRWVAAMACDGLAQVARAHGDTASARRLFAEELALHRALGDKHGIGHTLLILGGLAEEEGDVAGAGTCYAEALTMLRDFWDPGRLTGVLRGVAALALAQEQPARALRLAGAVAAVPQHLWSPEAWERERLGEEARKHLSPEAAVAAWEEGRAMSLEQAVAYALERSGGG